MRVYKITCDCLTCNTCKRRQLWRNWFARKKQGTIGRVGVRITPNKVGFRGVKKRIPPGNLQIIQKERERKPLSKADKELLNKWNTIFQSIP